MKEISGDSMQREPMCSKFAEKRKTELIQLLFKSSQCCNDVPFGASKSTGFALLPNMVAVKEEDTFRFVKLQFLMDICLK